VPPRDDLPAELYDFYLRAAVEVRQITTIESDELRYLIRLFGIHSCDLEKLRNILISSN
jgi:hypothetical protein